MAHIEREKSALLTRVRKIKGQAAALEKSLSEETDCLAVLQQVTAIRGAVNGLMTKILEMHIREHIGATDITDEERAKEIDDVALILKSYLK